MQWVHQARAWLTYKWNWANRNRLFWANIALVFVVLGVLFYPLPSVDGRPVDLRFRLLGLLLQLIGVGTVWRDLARTAAHFDRGGFLSRTFAWLKEFGKPPGGVIGGGGTLPGDMARGRGRVRTQLVPDASVPERLAAIEKYVSQVDASLDTAHVQIDELRDKLDAQIEAEKQERERAVGSLHRDLREAVTGNYALLVFGLAWLVTGIFLATFAQEIAVLLWLGRWSTIWHSA